MHSGFLAALTRRELTEQGLITDQLDRFWGMRNGRPAAGLCMTATCGWLWQKLDIRRQ
ncbi:hypothetical protein [Sulfitobacter sediminilitoris]|uniref:hypothetical protein n=1 Tax=Sulfitobacter sediminilitoris TaxID=2698830 RepID=UPI0036178415